MKICSLCQRCYDDEAVFCVEEGHPALPESRDRDRHCVDGYHLDHLLQIGQHWETYRAIEEASGRPCLIRIILPNAPNAEQFLGEATLAATLFNPSFADVYDAGTLAGGEFFAVTEETEGETVRQVLKRSGPPKLVTTVEIIRQTAEALYALHNNGLVHRAIRPENIVLTTDTDDSLFVRLQCPDFGGAIERSITSNKFLIDTALDSLRYYAPEQFAGEPSTPQTDLYSLGIVLFEMLAGTPPFDAPKATALIAKHRNQQPPELRIADFNLRMLLTHTLKESLHKQARLRQSSANAFARQLRHIEQLATHVSTPPPAGTVPVPTRERPVVVAAAPATPSRVVISQPEIIVQMESSTPQVIETVGREVERTTPAAYPVEMSPAVVEPQPPILERALERLSENYDGRPAERDEPAITCEPESGHADPIRLSGPVSASVPAITITEPEAVTAADRSRMRIRKRKLRSKVIRAVNAIADDLPRRPLDSHAPEPVSMAEAGVDEPNRSGIALPDRNTVEAAMREALAARSARPVKKIELKLFDDDLPTDTDALQSAAIDQAVDLMTAAPKPIDNATSVEKIRKRIEWTQPEDDIPTQSDVLEALAQQDVPNEAEIEAAMALPGLVLPVREPGPPLLKVELSPEITDSRPPIPAAAASAAIVEKPIETVVEPLFASRPKEELPRVETIVRNAAVAAPPAPAAPLVTRSFAVPAVKPTRIEFDESAVNLGTLGKIIEAKASEDPDRTRPSEQDHDEITLVTPPNNRRISIDIKQPGRWKVTPRAGYGETFVPTILGAAESEISLPVPDAEHKDPILSVYYGAAADANRRSPYRSLVMGAGFLVAVVLLLFGNVLVREEARTEAAGTTVTSKTFPAQNSPPQPARSNFVPTVKEVPVKASEKRVASDVADETGRVKKREDPVTNKEQTKVLASKTESQTRPTRSGSVKPVNEKPRVVPSTIVISSDNGKVRSKVEPQSKPPVKSGSPNKNSTGTRPRIVMVP